MRPLTPRTRVGMFPSYLYQDRGCDDDRGAIELSCRRGPRVHRIVKWFLITIKAPGSGLYLNPFVCPVCLQLETIVEPRAVVGQADTNLLCDHGAPGILCVGGEGSRFRVLPVP